MTATPLTAERGRSVTIKYSIYLEDGTAIGDERTKPLTFKMGKKRIIPALEKGVEGMQVNEIRTIPIKAEEGYGNYNQELVLRVERKQFPEDLRLVPGRTLQYQTRDGERANFVVLEVDSDNVTIDGNHPLAGQDLKYEVQLLEVK